MCKNGSLCVQDQNQTTGSGTSAVSAADALKQDVHFVPKGLNQANLT